MEYAGMFATHRTRLRAMILTRRLLPDGGLLATSLISCYPTPAATHGGSGDSELPLKPGNQRSVQP